MVCVDDNSTKCVVHNIIPKATEKKLVLVVRPQYTVEKVFSEIKTQFSYTEFDLILQPISQQESVFLNDKEKQIMYKVPGFVEGDKNNLILMPFGSWKTSSKKKIDLTTTSTPVTPDPCSDDDLALGASASPTEPEMSSIPPAPALPMFDTSESASTNYKIKLYSAPRPAVGYVGLVNQAMTCYLNSLLQALFMTPEFRNALYNWQFDDIEEAKSIPYQLQKLFLNLQTSQKLAVETTDLTRSFGWDSTEAWHQHDIQELCRVMFDALERKFKNTEQADLINRLYEGKMTDYVKCLECKTEKSREDTFLDIPLPVRPFGSNVAYGSVEEALRAFVQPETLEENNQYFCEKCNKKCDAHKGLKFKKFPYILTLHLKRFDFDYNTLHRIKLNDKVTFPQTLNLNCLVNATDVESFNNGQINGFSNSNNLSENENIENGAKFDDCSTTDSGAALEEDIYNGIPAAGHSSHHENDLQDDDEGIDMGPSSDNKKFNLHASGPYLYELFAIMIHSGSASGGHYYAYIKEFENDKWYCFNDQTVSAITQEDIQKSFGGGSLKTYYSGAYSSSTNAYMLMYRQSDTARNAKGIKIEEFPEHIKKLMETLNDTEKETKRTETIDHERARPKVYFFDPNTKQVKERRVYISKTAQLENVLETAHTLLSIDEFAPMSRSRLVAYNPISEEVECSLEGRDEESIGSVLSSLPADTEFLLEIRNKKQEFEVYKTGEIPVKVYKVDLKSSNVIGPHLIRVSEGNNTLAIKKLIAKKLGVKSKDIILALSSICSDVLILKDKEEIHKLTSRSKLFVACEKSSSEATVEQFRKIVQDNFTHLMYLYLSLPNTEKSTLESLTIPEYEPKTNNFVDQRPFSPKQLLSDKKINDGAGGGDVVDAVMMNGNIPTLESNHLNSIGDFKRSSPIPPTSGAEFNVNLTGGCESNSEDSSLSDGDRTLVESTQNISSTSTSPQLLSPENKSGKKDYILAEDVSDDEDYEYGRNFYFTALNETIEGCSSVSSRIDTSSDSSANCVNNVNNNARVERIVKIIVDKRTKLIALKRHLEPILQVPSEYFKFIRKTVTIRHEEKQEFTNLYDSLITFKDGDLINIELGRNLKKGEHKAEIFYLKLSEITNEVGKLMPICEWIFKSGLKVIDAKRELVAHLQKMDGKYSTLTIENCRLWEKSGRNPSKILQNERALGTDEFVSNNCELIVQECECDNKCPVTDETSLTLFVRHWGPETLELGKFQEVTLYKNTEIRNALSQISDIPEDKIHFVRVSGSFPCTSHSLLSIDEMPWFHSASTTDNYPLSVSQNGSVYYFKDGTELKKDLSTDERADINKKEKARIERFGGTASSYSPRRERALKIYLDSSPKASEE